MKDVDEEKENKAVRFSHVTTQALKKVFDSENPVLVNLPVWGEGSTKTEDREVILLFYVLYASNAENDLVPSLNLINSDVN